jgi:pseudouridine-5'-monophosphatase
MSGAQPARTPSRNSVLFDLDGVLLDTERLYTQATQSVVGRFGKTFTWDVKKLAMGRDASVSARIVLDRLDVPISTEDFLAERNAVLIELLAECRAMEGAEAFVRQLRAAGVRMAVATSSDRDFYELKTRPHAWFDLFDAVVCGDDVRVKAKKPAPDIFLVAARELGAAPEQCLVFEDSPAGVEAATGAGMRVVAIPDPGAGVELFTQAHRIVQSWAEVSASIAALLDG